MYIFISVVTLILLFVLSSFWSVAETALTSLSKYRIKKIIALNKSLAEELKLWLKSPYYILTTILVADTVTSLAISFLALVIALDALSFLPRGAVEILTWLVVTFIALIFCEIAPKIYGRYYSEKATLIVLPALARLIGVIRPLVWPFLKIVQLAFPRQDLVPVSRLTYLSVEEIKGLISEADTKGMLGRDTSRMLQAALRLGELEVRQIMTPADRIESVNLDQDEERFLDMAVETGRSRVPVYHGAAQRMAGFVYTKDLLIAWRKHHGSFSPNLIRPAYFVPQDMKVHELLKNFQSGQTHLAFVTDAFNNLAGLVTVEDVLEEIVGEILDEYDLRKEQEGT